MVINPTKNSPACAKIKDASIYHALSPWTALYRDYITKLKSVDMFVLLRQEYECNLSAAPLEESPGIKYAHFNLSSLLRPEPLPGHRFDDEKELLELWRTEHEWRMSELDEEDSDAGAQNERCEITARALERGVRMADEPAGRRRLCQDTDSTTRKKLLEL